MKYIYFTYLFLFMFSISGFSQNNIKKKNIIEKLTTENYGKGKVIINQNPLLDSLINKHINNYNIKGTGNDIVSVDRGYRIQIFSSNNQREAKQQAESMENKLKDMYPDLSTYVKFYSPFWKLRVGNYRTLEEAHAVLRDLKKTFPNWKEMFIVEEKIEFPLYNY